MLRNTGKGILGAAAAYGIYKAGQESKCNKSSSNPGFFKRVGEVAMQSYEKSQGDYLKEMRKKAKHLTRQERMETEEQTKTLERDLEGDNKKIRYVFGLNK
jgi:hypothetical protein